MSAQEEIELGGLRTIVVVLLHGFSMVPEDLAPFAHTIGVDAWFVFPEGPVTAEPRGRAWWHMDAAAREAEIARGPRDFAIKHPPDLPRGRDALNGVLDAVYAEAKGRPVFVGGFSQGGMIVCDTLLRRPRETAGIVFLSSSRVGADDWTPFLANARGWRVLATHGEVDADLAFSAGVALKDMLVTAGADVTWVPFETGHEIPLVAWRALRKFLRAASP